MHCALLVTLFIIGVFCEDGTYTNKYDNVDLENIVNNERLLKNYVNCLLEKGKCTPDGAELKKNIPDALETNCGKCSEKQKQGIKKVVQYLTEHKKDWWNELVQKYDADGTYRKKYAALREKEEVYF